MIKLILFRAFSLICATAAALLVARYPLGWGPLLIGLGAYAAVIWYRPHWWVYALLTLLPVLNLYPWTGWLFIEEIDLAVLTTLAVGYWRASPRRPETRITPLGRIAIALVAMSYIVSAILPLREFSGWTWEALATYNTPLNSLRVLKAFAWPLLLLPLLLRTADALGANFRQVLGHSMMAGLTVASLVVLWERNAFPGIMNFSSDYRAIGSFFEAHVGGAAVDGYLALGLPFAMAFLLAARTPTAIALGAMILMAGTYAAFATFSRGLYAGIALAAALVGGLALVQQPKAGHGFRTAALLIIFAVGAILLTQVFASGGYRTLAAALGACSAAAYLGGVAQKPRLARTLAIFTGLAIATVLCVQFVPKGAYLVYAASLLATGALATYERIGRLRHTELLFAACAWVGINTVAVGWHWGGAPAMQDASMAVLVAGVLATYNRGTPAPLWVLSWRTASAVITSGLLVAIAIPVVSNYYMKDRTRAVSRDLQIREDHWQGALDMKGGGVGEAVFGAGLGSYPERYFWRNHKGEFPGSITLLQEAGDTFARLGGPRTNSSYGDVLRFSQRIAVGPEQPLTLTIKVRSPTPKSVLVINICEKWLLYTERCTSQPAVFKPTDAWTHYTAKLNTMSLGQTSWWGKRPMILAVSGDGRRSVIDITDIQLETQSGTILTANGELASGGDSWFFTSDYSHLPWHAKNLWLGIWFEQGWFGLGSILVFLAVVLTTALRSTRSGKQEDQALAAALAAFLIVGLFDTLLDATRVGLVFFLLSFSALVMRSPFARRPA